VVRGLAALWTIFLHCEQSSVALTDSTSSSPVHVLMLSCQAVHGIPCFCRGTFDDFFLQSFLNSSLLSIECDVVPCLLAVCQTILFAYKVLVWFYPVGSFSNHHLMWLYVHRAVVRFCSSLLTKVVDSLAPSITAILVRGKQVSGSVLWVWSRLRWFVSVILHDVVDWKITGMVARGRRKLWLLNDVVIHKPYQQLKNTTSKKEDL